VTELDGRVVLVTGGNSGIGERTAAALAEMGARVFLTSRSRERADTAAQRLRRETGRPDIDGLELDLSSLAGVDAFADDFLAAVPRLHVLVCNAGLYLTRREETADGHEMTLGVNHLGHFHLVQRLRERLVASAPARIIVVSSDAHRGAAGGLDFDDLEGKRSFWGWQAYCRSKLANIFFTRELARRLAGTGVTANAVHPGLVDSGFGGDGDAGPLMKLGLDIARPFMLSAQQGARTVVFLASAPEVETRTGGYWVRKRERRPSRWARDDAAAARLWTISERWVAEARGVKTVAGGD
jgi:NAD(P)-dependent dehydrogenase (short-subunit alcohol dehydrogenase family)